MDAIEKGARTVGGFEVLNIPVGQAILLLAGLGINDVLVPVLSKFLKMPILSGAALSVISKLPVVENVIGKTLGDVLAATAIATGIDEQLAIRERTKAWVATLVSKASVVTSGAPAAVSTGRDTGLLNEYERRVLSIAKAQ